MTVSGVRKWFLRDLGDLCEELQLERLFRTEALVITRSDEDALQRFHRLRVHSDLATQAEVRAAFLHTLARSRTTTSEKLIEATRRHNACPACDHAEQARRKSLRLSAYDRGAVK